MNAIVARRRFTEHKPNGDPWLLSPEHPAAVEGRTRYPATRKDPANYRVLKSGMNSRKIGDRVTKGAWKGMPIFTLTLEERATCPRSCMQWLNCFGNKMHWAHRFVHGLALELRLEEDLAQLQRRHPGGFVVRLHVLGDFYSTTYVRKWSKWLDRFPALRIFGYTAHTRLTPIGRWIVKTKLTHRDRFSIRFSGERSSDGTVVVDRVEDIPRQLVRHSVVCPAQTGKTDCCGSCALCWSAKRCVVFLKH